MRGPAPPRRGAGNGTNLSEMIENDSGADMSEMCNVFGIFFAQSVY